MPEQEHTQQSTTQEKTSRTTGHTLVDQPANRPPLQGTIRFTGHAKNGGQPMQVGRFLMGMLTSAVGVTTMLVVAFGVFQGWGMDERLSLPVIAISMILGLMLLGGGFGVMATSAGTFDDDEFERLMAGEQRRFDEDGNATLPKLTSDLPVEDGRERSTQSTSASLSC